MDKFKETIMVNTLTNTPNEITTDNITAFFEGMDNEEAHHYGPLLRKILENQEQTHHILMLSSYIFITAYNIQ